MSKPSERIVVFVTTAQKRAITATAEDLGISVSELMRRAVLSFGATSEQVKAASIVDRLRAPRAPDALNAALQRVARGTRYARASVPAALQTRDTGGDIDSDTKHSPSATAAPNPPDVAGISASPAPVAPGESVSALKASPAASIPLSTVAAAKGGSLLPAGVVAALAAEQDEQAAASAEALARLIADRAADAADINDATRGTDSGAAGEHAAPPPSGTPASLRNSLKRRRASADDDEPHGDPSTEGGHFA